MFALHLPLLFEGRNILFQTQEVMDTHTYTCTHTQTQSSKMTSTTAHDCRVSQQLVTKRGLSLARLVLKLGRTWSSSMLQMQARELTHLFQLGSYAAPDQAADNVPSFRAFGRALDGKMVPAQLCGRNLRPSRKYTCLDYWST